MMATKKRWIFSGLLLLIAVVGLLTWNYQQEPRYKGRPLSYWARQLARNSPDSAYFSFFYEKDLDEKSAEEFRQAIRSLGPNAAPYFLKELSWRRSALKTWLQQQSFYKQLGFPSGDAFDSEQLFHKSCAHIGFEIMGTNAAIVAPELRKLLQKPDFAEEVAALLPAVGQAAMPAINDLCLGTNSNAQQAFLFALNNSTSTNLFLAHQLLTLARSRDRFVRTWCVRSFVPFGVPFTNAIPFLQARLAEQDPLVNEVAAQALAAYSEKTPEAVVALEQAKIHKDARVRFVANSALKRLKENQPTASSSNK